MGSYISRLFVEFLFAQILLGGESEAQVNLLKLADERQPGCGVTLLPTLVFLVSQQTEGSAPEAHCSVDTCTAGACASLLSPSYQGPYKKILCKASL